jgi:hypothetical protein
MDIMKMLDELRQEREAIEEAILTLERSGTPSGTSSRLDDCSEKEANRRSGKPGYHASAGAPPETNRSRGPVAGRYLPALQWSSARTGEDESQSGYS